MATGKEQRYNKLRAAEEIIERAERDRRAEGDFAHPLSSYPPPLSFAIFLVCLLVFHPVEERTLAKYRRKSRLGMKKMRRGAPNTTKSMAATLQVCGCGLVLLPPESS